jgi:hypothetical protein
MSALIENKITYFLSTIDKEKNESIINFFKKESRFLDIDHTHIMRYRIKVWSITQNCARYQCTMDWYMDRHINESDGGLSSMDTGFDEKLVIKTWGRSTPSIDIFNTQAFIEETNAIIKSSKIELLKNVLNS